MIPLWKILDVVDSLEDLARRACFLNGLAPVVAESKPLPTAEIVTPTNVETNNQEVENAVR